MENNYILEYYQKIKNGTITAGKWILLEYEKVIKNLKDGIYFFDKKKADTAIVFIENYCRHSKGEWAPNAIKLELWQKALVSVCFGVVDKNGYRQFREIVLIVARKNGKTLFAAAIAAYCAFLDGEYGGEIYFTAPKLDQAAICYGAFEQMVFCDSTLKKLSKKRRSDIYIADNNTIVKSLAFSAQKSDGFNISLAVADEVASWVGDRGLKFYEVIKSSFGSRKQPLLLSISTAGYVDGGIYDELIKRSTRFLLGDSKETRLAPFLYIIDDPEKWNDINELQKSNPNMNVSVSVDYLLEEIAIAEGSLSKKREFLTKYCNIKQNSSMAWIASQDIENITGEPLYLEDFANCYCVGGIDLSRTTDLTACCIVIEKRGILYVFSKFFLPSAKIQEATLRDGLPYEIYIKRGLLQPSGVNEIDYKDCYNWFCDLIGKYKIYPLMIGYDRYCATYLVQDLKTKGFHVDDVYQGTNLTPVIHEAEGLIKDQAINIGDNDLLKIHLLNTALKYEADGNRCKPVKIRAQEHIDGTAALLDALTVRQKWYKDLGQRLKNQNIK